MNKKTCSFVALILALLIFSVTASSSSGYTYHFPIQDVTVEFESDTPLSEARRQEIAGHYAGEMELIHDGDDTNHILCFLFGHDISTNTVTVIRHRIKPRAPRCRLEVYHVDVCSRCDYTVDELVATSIINCCPED